MGDWQEIAQSVCIALIFAFMVAKLISVVVSFREDNLRVSRQGAIESLTETHEIEQTLLGHRNTAGESPPMTFDAVQSYEDDYPERVGDEVTEKPLEAKEETDGENLYGDCGGAESHLGGEDDDWEGIESTELDEIFGAATSYVASMAEQSSQKIPNDVQLQFYGLYKLATEGPCVIPPPSALKIAARAKWNAWQRLGTMSPEAAMQQYVALLTEIRPTWADRIMKKNQKQEEESSQRSMSTRGIGPVFSTFVHQEGSDDEVKLDVIHVCAKEADTAGLLQALEQGMPLDLRDSQGRTALHWAVDRGHLTVVELLISKGADVNGKDIEGQTPLHYATVCERQDIAKYLIAHGADASVKDIDGATPYNSRPTDWNWMSESA